jgi:hypothetical protein
VSPFCVFVSVPFQKQTTDTGLVGGLRWAITAIDVRLDRSHSRAARLLGETSAISIHEQAGQGADTRSQTRQVDAPPEHADGPGHRVVVGHGSAEDAACRPQDNRPEPESKGDSVASAA